MAEQSQLVNGFRTLAVLVLLLQSLLAQNSTNNAQLTKGTSYFKLMKSSRSIISSPECATDIPSGCQKGKIDGTSNVKVLQCLHNHYDSMATLEPQCQNV